MNGDRTYFQTALWEWRTLLDSRVKESTYQEFLRKHAGQFLCTSFFQAIVVSKLKLGSSYETDFVVVEDAFSEGITYTFVELEVPYAELFTKGNKPSDRLNTAVSQVRAWKQWLETHRSEALELLPSFPVRYGAPPRYRFIVVIGRRSPEAYDFTSKQRDRAWLSKYEGIEVRSFDFLTTLATIAPNAEAGKISHCPEEVASTLFHREWGAISHREWIRFIRSSSFEGYHLQERNWADLLKLRASGPRQSLVKEPNPANRADGNRKQRGSQRSST